MSGSYSLHQGSLALLCPQVRDPAGAGVDSRGQEKRKELEAPPVAAGFLLAHT